MAPIPQECRYWYDGVGGGGAGARRRVRLCQRTVHQLRERGTLGSSTYLMRVYPIHYLGVAPVEGRLTYSPLLHLTDTVHSVYRVSQMQFNDTVHSEYRTCQLHLSDTVHSEYRPGPQ